MKPKISDRFGCISLYRVNGEYSAGFRRKVSITQSMDELVNGRLDGVLNVAGEEFGGTEVGVSGDGSLVLVLLAMSGVGHHLVPYALGRRGGLDVEDHVGCL